jgi:hypothetical protein
MISEKRRLLSAILVLVSISGLFASIRLTWASWVERDAVYEVRASPTPTLERMAPHQKTLSTLRIWVKIADAASILSLAGFVFILQGHKTAHAVWLRTLMFGLLSFLSAVILLLSAGKGISDQRGVAVPMAVLALIGWGLILSGGLLTWTSGRLWAKIVGTLLILLEVAAFLVVEYN